MFKYILVGNGHKAMPIHSDMNWIEIADYIRDKIHKDSYDTVFSWGTIDFVNPRVMLLMDFVDELPALIGIK